MKKANRDEALRCKEIAMHALTARDYAKCIRLLEKSLKLYFFDEVNVLLSRIRSEAISGSRMPSSPRKHNIHTSPKNNSVDWKTRMAYTPEQLRNVQRIISSTTYYDILEISRNATDDEIKKAYRKLALRIHPDKCHAPGAEEAFKNVGKAFQCLSDASKRRKYDASGKDPQSSQQYPQGPSNFDPEFMSANDIFQAFFGNPQQTRQGNRGRQAGYHGQQNNHEEVNLFKFLPFLLIFGVSILSTVFQQPAQVGARFSFTPTTDFRFRVSTNQMEIPYYVRADHAKSHTPGSTARKKFDESVETLYIQSTANDCQYEERIARQKIQMATHRGLQDEVDLLTTQPRPSCDTLEALKSKYPEEFRRRRTSWNEL